MSGLVAATALVFDAAPAVQGAAQFEAAGKKIVAANTGVVNATARTTDAQANQERQLARLTRQIDPAAAAQAKLEAGQKLLERAFQRGTISAEEQTRKLALLDAKYAGAANSAQRFAAANDNASTSIGRVTSATDIAAASMGRFGAALTSPTAAIAAIAAASGAGVVQIARLGDEYTNTMNKLRSATGSVQAASAVYAELVAMSQQTGASIAESAGAFVRFSVAARSIGATNAEVIQLTRTIQQAGLISGASTQEAASGVQQLGQALASGKLQGDELRAILESMPTLAEALAGQLGVSIGQLRTMGSEGQLTSDRVFQALLRASETINKQFTELTPTMGRAFGVLGQAMVEFVGKLDQALGLSQAIARAATAAAGAVGSVSAGMGPRSPAAQAEFDVTQAQARMARLEAELASLSGEPGLYATPRRGTISRGMQEAAAQTQPREERLAELRQRIEAENAIVRSGLERQNQAHQEADDVRQAEEATAAARRQQAARAARQTAFNATRDALDGERKLRTEHADRIRSIDAGLANGDTNTTEAARLRRMASDELADGLKSLADAARARVATDQELVDVGRIVADMEKDRLALMREGDTVTQSVRTEVEKYAEQLSVLRTLLEQGAITQETYNRAVAAADPAVKAATEASRRIEQENTRVTDRITGFFGDAFARAFEGTGNGFRGLMESFKRAAISTFATIAAQAIIRPIIAPIVSGLGLGQLTAGGGGIGGINLGSLFGGTAQAATPGTGQGGITGSAGEIGTLRQAYNGLTSPGGLGSFFPGGSAINTGFGGLDALANTQMFGQSATSNAISYMGGGLYGPATPAAVAGAQASGAGGLTVAGSLGPLAAIGGGAYGFYSGIQKGGVGGGLGAAGGAVSAATGIGMLGAAAGLLPALGALGPIGLGIGAALSIAGALMPGQKPSGSGQSAFLQVDTNEVSYAGLGGSRFSQSNRDSSEAAARRITDLAREIGGKLGGAKFGGSVGVGTTSARNGRPGELYLEIGDNRRQFTNDEGGAKQLGEAAAGFILKHLREKGRTDGAYRGIIDASGDNLDRLNENLNFYENVWKSFEKTAEVAEQAADAVKVVEDRFGPLISKAQELSLSTDKMVEARDKEIAAIRKAMAEAEAARQAELTLIRSSIQARLDASNVTQTYEARLLAGNIARSRAWAEELKELEARLTTLGNTTADTATQLANLTAAQGAEYWRNFASSMADLDRSVIGRILRATNRGGQADLLDFEAGALAQIAGLSQAMADLGLSADIAAKKISETEQAIAAERLVLQKRVADEAAKIAAEQLAQVMRAGQGIRDYLNGLATNSGPGGVSREQALSAAQGQFASDLTGARQNDQDALARITGTAERLMEAGRGMYGSTLAYQQLRTMIVTSLQNLEQTRAYDASRGFATGGSFTASGPAGMDNLSLSNVRVTAGEVVNISRQDAMGMMASELRAMRIEVAELRREQAEGIRTQTRVIAAVGEETSEHGAQTVRLLSAQVGATRLAGAA